MSNSRYSVALTPALVVDKERACSVHFYVILHVHQSNLEPNLEKGLKFFSVIDVVVPLNGCQGHC